MKLYTIIGGVNGVGKSSLTGAIKAERTDLGMIIDVDKINASLGGDRIKGGKAAIKKIDSCIARGLSFTQETTLSGIRTINTMRKARENGSRYILKNQTKKTAFIMHYVICRGTSGRTSLDFRSLILTTIKR